MKKTVIYFTLLGVLIFILSAQEIQHEAIAINIEVAVRVFDGKTFIDTLTIDDFEVLEDGIEQTVEAVYLIKKTNIEKHDELIENNKPIKKFTPQVSRNFVLVFESTEYLPKTAEAIDYFFENILESDDALLVTTPVKSYTFNNRSFERYSREEIAEQLKKKLRGDTIQANRKFRSLLGEYESIQQIQNMEPDLKKEILKGILRQLRDHVYLSEKKLSDFSDYLKKMEGQKHVFLFYQKEMIPSLPGADPFDVMELQKDTTFDAGRIKRAFSDSSISVHFIFITKTPELFTTSMEPPRDNDKIDQSAQIFNAFREVAVATGGTVDSSANAEVSFQKAVIASENYYLVYYSPKKYIADGKFRRIEVKVKGKNYKVFHRAGYIAD
jgi:VWFA-related protein